MLKAYKYRLLPNTQQAEYIKRTIGCARFVYNGLLDDYKQQLTHYNETKADEDKPKLKLVTSLKQNNEFLNNVDSLALMNGRTNLEKALKNFFDSKKGKRKGKHVGFPTPHKKVKCRWNYTTNNQGGNIRVENTMICLPKVKWVKLKQHRELQGEIRSVTVSLERNGEFYVSILCNIETIQRQKQISGGLKVVGLDMSYSDFAVDSENTCDDTKPKYVRQYRVNEKKTCKTEPCDVQKTKRKQ